MNIEGTGIVSSLGRGVDTLHQVLVSGAPPPSLLDVPFQSSPCPVYAVSAETIKDRTVLARARRADRFSKMATLAASDAVSAAQVDLVPERTGIVLGTAFGPHPTVFKFLDEILEYGDDAVSPTVFSHSVHNAAAAYLSVALGLAGPAMTLTTFRDPFQQSLLLAQNWLDQGTCDAVLVGCVEECGPVLEYVVAEKLTLAERDVIPFFAGGTPAVIPGEGAVFFLLTRSETSHEGVEIERIGKTSDVAPDLWVVDFESSTLPESGLVGCWSHVTGSSPLSSAVSCAAGELMIGNETVYPATSLLDLEPFAPRRIGLAGTGGLSIYLGRS
jgi:3-oxoacyl-[acyl-carrier-protein] synthase II